jgi:hypothetical protein
MDELLVALMPPRRRVLLLLSGVVSSSMLRGDLETECLLQDVVVGVLDRQIYQGGTRGSRLCGEDRDRETENSKVCARTRDTRFIQVRVAKVANPTSCLGDQVWRPALGVGLRSGTRLGTQPSFI